MDKWLKDILPDKDPYHNRRRDQMRKKGGPEFECLWLAIYNTKSVLCLTMRWLLKYTITPPPELFRSFLVWKIERKKESQKSYQHYSYDVLIFNFKQNKCGYGDQYGDWITWIIIFFNKFFRKKIYWLKLVFGIECSFYIDHMQYI
jgi:hypothetical protein